MQTLPDQKLKKILKEAFVETLRENRELLHEVFAEVLEDYALHEAIEEGEKTPMVSRRAISRALGKRP